MYLLTDTPVLSAHSPSLLGPAVGVEETLHAAIVERRPVSVRYNHGAARTVHPHALFRTSTGTSVSRRVSDRRSNLLPVVARLRGFTLAKIASVELLDGEFDVAPGFDPAADKYANGRLAVVGE